MRACRFALLLSSVVLAAPAFAADYEPPVVLDDAPEYVPVEVGSGWYLRGDIGYTLDSAYDHGSEQLTRDLMFDLGFGPINYEEDESMLSGSLGIGYHFTDWLRSDLNIGYIDGNEVGASFDGEIDGDEIQAEADLENSAWYGMANLYADLGTYAGFTPYVGAGAGLIRSAFDGDASLVINGEQEFAASWAERDYAFAYTLNAGLAYHFGGGLSADLGYQYFDAPDAEFIQVKNLEDNPIQEGLDFHQVRLGLRYDLW